MLREEKGSRKNVRRLAAAAVLLVAAMAACTVISAKNYMNSLNRVTTTSSVSNQLRTTTESGGSLRYSHRERLPIPEGCGIETEYVRKGSSFAEGDPLLQMEGEDLLLKSYETAAEISALEEAIAAESGEERRQVLQLQKENLEEEKGSVDELLEADGILYAPCAGQVIEYNPSGETAELVYGIADGSYYLEWSVEREEYKEFSNIEATVRNQKIPLEEVTVTYDEGTQRYMFRTEEIALEFADPVMDGEYAQVTQQYISEEYPAVIPKTSIRYDGDGFSYVYLVEERETVLGTETYVVKTGVTILEEDAKNAAVLAELTDLVENSSRELTDLEAVLVIDTQE